MPISPQRRRRTLREHQLRQNGYTLEQIAEKVNVSVSTVHADLRLLETNWSDFAQATRNDLLLQQINRVNRRVGRLINTGVVGLELCRSVDEALRARALYAQELNAACRELRLLLASSPPTRRTAARSSTLNSSTTRTTNSPTRNDPEKT